MLSPKAFCRLSEGVTLSQESDSLKAKVPRSAARLEKVLVVRK